MINPYSYKLWIKRQDVFLEETVSRHAHSSTLLEMRISSKTDQKNLLRMF